MIEPEVAKKFLGKKVKIMTYKEEFDLGRVIHLLGIDEKTIHKSYGDRGCIKVCDVTKTTITIWVAGVFDFFSEKVVVGDNEQFPTGCVPASIQKGDRYYYTITEPLPKIRHYTIALSAIVYITEVGE